MQNPYKVDQLAILPGNANGSRVIYADSDGNLMFKDATITGGISLSGLKGLQGFSNIYVVSADGGEYTTIQEALDAVSPTSSRELPALILLLPGVYDEDLTIYRDGVVLMGLGGVTLRSLNEGTPNTGANSSITIQSDLGTTPKNVTISNVVLSNSHDSMACLRIVGSSTSQVGLYGITLNNVTFKAVAAGGNFPIWGTSFNTIEVSDCNFSTTTSDISLLKLLEVSRVVFNNVRALGALQLRWDVAQALPLNVATKFSFSNCPLIAQGSALSPALTLILTGGSTAEFVNCDFGGDVSISGNRFTEFHRCHILGALTVADTSRVSTFATTRVGSLVANGTAELREDVQNGVVSFVAEDGVTVTFDIPQPDTDYTVSLELSDAVPAAPYISSKTVNGFVITVGGASTLDIAWKVLR